MDTLLTALISVLPRREHVTLARVLATDPRRDLALLFVTTIPAGLRYVPLAEPGGVEVGQDVYAIGHPKGLLWSYTEGVVSQIRPDFQWKFREGSMHQATVIQIADAHAPRQFRRRPV